MKDANVDFVWEPLEGTPFMIVRDMEGWNLAISNYRMWKEHCNSKEELLEKLEDNKWEVIAKMCEIIVDLGFKMNEVKTK